MDEIHHRSSASRGLLEPLAMFPKWFPVYSVRWGVVDLPHNLEESEIIIPRSSKKDKKPIDIGPELF
jgi:hypothetical protein